MPLKILSQWDKVIQQIKFVHPQAEDNGQSNMHHIEVLVE